MELGKVRLTIKTIIRWEQMKNKPFTEIDYTDESDVEVLLYVSVICNNPDLSYTLEEFKHLKQNEKIIRHLAGKLEKEGRVIAQFQTSNDKTSGSSESGYLKDIVSTLILAGLSPAYVMNEMELCDLPLFIEAYERQKREQMEASRLWTFFNILPHVDGSKLKQPSDMMLFPWEEDRAQEEAERALLEDKASFEAFMKEGNKILYNN